MTMRSMRTTRSKSASRLPPFSLILNRISPSRGIHSSSVFGSPSSMRVRTSDASSGSLAPTEWKTGMLARGVGGHVAVEIFAFERGAEIVRQIAAHERGAVRFVAAPPERLSVRVVESGVERAGHDQRAQLRDRHRPVRGLARDRWLRGDTPARARGTRSIGWPCSSHAAVSEAHESRERAHRAEPRVLVGCGEGPRVPERHRPESPRLASGTGPDPAIDVQERDAIDGSSAELIRRPILELLEPMVAHRRCGCRSAVARRRTDFSRAGS